MAKEPSRRGFLASSAALAALAASRAGAQPFKTTLHKAVIAGKPTEQSLKKLKDVGFEGIECRAWNTPPAEAAKCREVAEKVGMRIHSVLRGWVNFNKPKSVERDIASVTTALKAAQGFGADAILLVPCRTGGMPIPNPWEFEIEFDPKTGHVSRVVKGDNADELLFLLQVGRPAAVIYTLSSEDARGSASYQMVSRRALDLLVPVFLVGPEEPRDGLVLVMPAGKGANESHIPFHSMPGPVGYNSSQVSLSAARSFASGWAGLKICTPMSMSGPPPERSFVRKAPHAGAPRRRRRSTSSSASPPSRRRFPILE